MGLEIRNGHFYFTQSKRVNGRVQRTYVGSGYLALMEAFFTIAERQDEKTRQERLLAAWKSEQQEIKDLDQIVSTLCHEVKETLRIALQAAGYYQHTRGEWRKKRQERNIG